jgi:signal transduction histidine kinase
MKHDLYGSVVSKLASVAPMFAKSIVDAALEQHGLTPATVTPAQMMRLIRDEIQPKVRKFTLSDDEVMALGAGQIATDGGGFVVQMDPMSRHLLGLPPRITTDDPRVVARLKDIGMGPGAFICVRPYVREFHYAHSNRDLNVAMVPRYDAEGRPDGCLAILQDVTLRVALEQEVERYEEELRAKNTELEQANRHKDDFLARMSHELRTPLHCIIGYTEMALRDGGSLEEPEPRQNLKTTMACARDLLGLINDVFDLSTVETGALGVRRREVLVHELVAGCIETVRPLVGEKDIRLEAVVREPVVLYTDPLRIKQILLNLLGNAIKFTEKGRVTVEVDPPTNGTVSIHVSDTGIGIALDDHERIFERFYQVDASTTRRYGGAGLGLALVRHLARILGGRVLVDSEPGQGSRFTLRLPAGA